VLQPTAEDDVSKLLIIVAAVLALATVACGSEVLEGDVDHKTVNGEIEDTGWTLLQNLPAHDPDVVDDRPSIRIEDEEYRGFFTSEDEQAVITAEMENHLGQKYSNIRYTVNVRVLDVGGNEATEPYYVSREFFNRILVDGPVRFEASGDPAPTINKLLEPE
jgi:hypothetical protein